MEGTPEVRIGIWTDHGQSSWNVLQITTEERVNTARQLIIGVFFGAAWSWLSDILVRSTDWLRYWYRHWKELQNPVSNPLADVNDRTPLMDQHHRQARSRDDIQSPAIESREDAVLGQIGALIRYQSTSTAFTHRSSSTPSDRASTASNSMASRNRNASTLTRGLMSMLLSLVLITGIIAYSVAGSFSTMIPVDSSALIVSKHCGSWSLQEDAGKEAEDDDDLFQAQKEIRAAQYGRNCYGHSSVTASDGCTFFESQAIPYSVQREQACPFKDKNFCAGGGYTATRFTTGLVEANLLGINTGKPPKFNRTTICVPLNLDQGFVKEIPPDSSHHDYQFEYYLGYVGDSGYHSNYTFRMFGDPFSWDVPAYTLSVYEATPYPENNYWNPIHELDINHPGSHYLTIMFISSCRIIYTGPSNDYIFPADQPYPHSHGRYWNSDPRARPLTCIDWNEVCTPDDKCSPMDEEHPEYGVEYEFTRSALRKSTTFHSVQFRLGTALVAQESVGDYESRPLDDHQWITESTALFNTSLARIQYDTFDIAIGLGHEKDPGSYKLDTPSWARDKLCGMYKFKLPRGYTNINVWITVATLVLVSLLIVLGQQTHVEFTGDKKDAFKGNWMVFDLTLWAAFTTLFWISRGLRHAIHVVSVKAKEVWENRHRRA